MRSFQCLLGLVVLSSLVFLSGCGGVKLADASGRLTMDGKPLDGMKVIFVPDAEFGGKGRISSGVTDSDGRFVLNYEHAGDTPPAKGVAVGKVRVYLMDNKADESGRGGEDEASGAKIDVRVPFAYLNLQSSPIRFEVTKGSNEFDIELSKFPVSNSTPSGNSD